MTTNLYANLATKKQELIRKARDGSAFIGPITTTAITALTTGTPPGLSVLPTGMKDVGWTSTDGVTYGRTTTVTDINSFGSVEATRSDVTKDEITMQLTMQETNVRTLGLYLGADLSAALADHTTGEFQVAKPARPGVVYNRVLGLFVDDTDNGELYIGRYMPRARVTAFGEQKYNDGADPIQYQVTLTGYEDSVLGYSHKWFFAGPGWLALLASMGVNQATT